MSLTACINFASSQTRVIERAKKDALSRSEWKKVDRVKARWSDVGTLMGVMVELGHGDYADYFIYGVNTGYSSKEEIVILSEHLGDDQGSELKVHCKGWVKGEAIK